MTDELDKTIGDVFKQFEKSLNQLPDDDHPTTDHNGDNNDVNLETNQQNENFEFNNEFYHDKDYLDDAITDVFDSLKNELERSNYPTEKDNNNEETNHDNDQGEKIHKDTHSEEYPSHQGHMNNEGYNVPQPVNENDEPVNDDNDGDDDLANAISNALQSINDIRPQEFETLNDKPLEVIQGEEQNQPPQQQTTDEESLPHQDPPKVPDQDITHEQIQQQVTEEQQHKVQQNHQDQPTQQLQEETNEKYSPLEMEKDDDLDLENAIGDAFASLKQTVPESVSEISSKPQPPLIPSENDDKQDKEDKEEVDDDDLSKAITDSINMIKDKISKPTYQPPESNDTIDHEHQPAEEDDEDDELQKTIANAMKSVISEPTTSEPDLNNSQMNDILVNAFNMAMESPHELLNNLDEPISKKLSIAETLSLHRSKDFHISSILSNLNSSSGDGSSGGGILNIIKQIASFINNSNFQVFKHSSNLISIITSYKSQPEIFLTSLTIAKHYLRSTNRMKSIIPIDNVLLLFGKNNGPLIDYNPNLITLINNLIINVISNYQNNKIKPRNDMEYKEKIRLENRERKKRWREDNAERNKDNDLRARVSKRANLMFGNNGNQEEKAKWIEEEFIKRKEKRLSRQLKDKEDLKSSNNKIVNDKNLIKLVDDYFTIFSNFSPRDDNETGLYTTTTAMSCVGIIYLMKFGYIDVKRIDSIISSVVSNLIDGLNGIDHQERIEYLSKGARYYLPDSNIDIDSNYQFNQSQTRPSQPQNHSLQGEVQQPDQPQQAIPPVRAQIHQADMEIDSVKQDNDKHIDLKFPRYKNQKKEEIKLRKPGSFKRPGYQVKEVDGRYPKFYSTSIKPT